jgi:uncharacterized protein (TIGR02145 family)
MPPLFIFLLHAGTNGYVIRYLFLFYNQGVSMTVIKALFAGLAAMSLCSAQSVNISGKVTDTGGTALPGAIVSLETGGQTTTTGVDGSFLLAGTANITEQNNQFLPQKLSATVHNGVLYVNVKEKSAVVITTFNLQGQVVSTIQRTMEAATHPIALPHRGAGVYLYKVKSGKSEFLIRSHSIGRVSGGTEESVEGSSSNALAKQARSTAAINDVIVVTKSGYLNYRVVVTNSDTGGIEIKMIVCEATVTDIDGNTYQAVKIGNQVWMTENFRATRLNDGTAIPHVDSIQGWTLITTPAYVLYNNTTNADSIRKFGALYNWLTVDTKKLAPAGWHVPTDAEWDTLQNFLIAKGYNWDGTTSGNKIAKSLAAKAYWVTWTDSGVIGNDLTKNNRSGFSAMPAGSRYYDVNFNYIGKFCYWWSANAEDEAHAHYRMLNTSLDFLDNYISLTSCGFSIRLMKD